MAEMNKRPVAMDLIEDMADLRRAREFRRDMDERLAEILKSGGMDMNDTTRRPTRDEKRQRAHEEHAAIAIDPVLEAADTLLTKLSCVVDVDDCETEIQALAAEVATRRRCMARIAYMVPPTGSGRITGGQLLRAASSHWEKGEKVEMLSRKGPAVEHLVRGEE